MLIGISLGILIVLTIFNIVVGSSFDEIIFGTYDMDAVINGSDTSYTLDNLNIIFNINSLTGAIAIIIIVGLLCTILGIRILGSGISETSVRFLTTCVFYTGIWSLFSVLSYELIINIKVFGLLLYITLTIIFVLGVVQKLTSNNNG